MQSRNIPYIPALDHLRGFAAILVMLFHGVLYISHRIMYEREFDDSSWLNARDPISSLIIEGHTGVSLFFVLSGFIFMVGARNRQIRWFGFLKNRFLRTYPLFLFSLGLGVVFYTDNFTVNGFIKSVMFLANLPSAFNGGPFTFVAWSIAIEWQFYLLFPVLITVIKKIGIGLLPALIVLMLLIRWLLFEPDIDMRAISYWTIAGRLDQFLIGMIAGWIFTRGMKFSWKTDLIAVAGMGMVLGALFAFNQMGGGHLTNHVWIYWPTLEAICWSTFVIGYISVARHLNTILSKLLISLGTISYSIYLVHYVVLFLLMTYNLDATVSFGGPVDTALANTVLLALPPVLIISTLTYYVIERPFLNLRGQYLRNSDK